MRQAQGWHKLVFQTVTIAKETRELQQMDMYIICTYPTSVPLYNVCHEQRSGTVFYYLPQL